MHPFGQYAEDNSKILLGILCIVLLVTTIIIVVVLVTEQTSCESNEIYNEETEECEQIEYVCENGDAKPNDWFSSSFLPGSNACNSCYGGYELNEGNLSCQRMKIPYTCQNGTPQDQEWEYPGINPGGNACNSCSLGYTLNTNSFFCTPNVYTCPDNEEAVAPPGAGVQSVLDQVDVDKKGLFMDYFKEIKNGGKYCSECFNDLDIGTKYYIYDSDNEKALIVREGKNNHLNDTADDGYHSGHGLYFIPIVEKLPKKWTYKGRKGNGYWFKWGNSDVNIILNTVHNCENVILNSSFKNGPFRSMVYNEGKTENDQKMCDFLTATPNNFEFMSLKVTDDMRDTDMINKTNKCFTERYTSQLHIGNHKCRSIGSSYNHMIQCNTNDYSYFSFYTTPHYMFENDNENENENDIVTFRNYDSKKYCTIDNDAIETKLDKTMKVESLSSSTSGENISTKHIGSLFCNYDLNDITEKYKGNKQMLYTNGDANIYNNKGKKLCYYHKFSPTDQYSIKVDNGTSDATCEWKAV